MPGLGANDTRGVSLLDAAQISTTTATRTTNLPLTTASTAAFTATGEPQMSAGLSQSSGALVPDGPSAASAQYTQQSVRETTLGRRPGGTNTLYKNAIIEYKEWCAWGPGDGPLHGVTLYVDKVPYNSLVTSEKAQDYLQNYLRHRQNMTTTRLFTICRTNPKTLVGLSAIRTAVKALFALQKKTKWLP